MLGAIYKAANEVAKLILIVAAIVVAIYFGQQLLQQRVPVAARIIPTDCTLGWRNSAASLRMQGLGAQQACDKLVGEVSNFYVSSQAHFEPVLCEYTVNGVHITVRDQGVLTLVGKQLCGMVSQWRPGG